MLRSVALWLDQRLHLTRLFASTAGHAVPASAHSWFYVFGSGTLLCFIIQVVTGICLAFVYAPTANDAWTSLLFLNYQQPLGWLLRAMHYWGSNFMVAVMTLHMVQVFLFGAYKYPRELTWISGCILLLCTLGMAFTGQILRFDEDAYWGLGIGASIMGRAPFIGSRLVQLMLAGPIIAAETLSRFFTLHVFVIPGLIIALVSVHLRLVLTAGINEYPQPGKLVRKETYVAEYEALVAAEGVPFVPKAIGKDLIFSALLMVGDPGLLGGFWSFWPEWAAGSDPDQYRTTAGFLLSVAVCSDGPAAGILGDVSPPRRACHRYWVPLCPAIPVWHRREEPAPAPRRRVERHADIASHRAVGVSGDVFTVVAPDGRLERCAHTCRVCQGADAS